MKTPGICCTLVACCLSTASVALGADEPAPGGGLSLTPEPAPLAPLPEIGLLMQGLERLGLGKPMEDLGLRAHGYAEVGYTYGLKHGSGGQGGDNFLYDRFYELHRNNIFVLNQVDLALEREIKDRTKFDIGGKMEVIYGADTYLLHSNGLDVYAAGGDGTFGRTGALHSPNYQIGFIQLFADINLPVMEGWNVRVGKFYSPFGCEGVDPTARPFYSISFLASTQPTTFTGVQNTLQINKQWAVSLGVARGWEQSVKDNNGAVTGFGGATWQATDKLSIAVNVSVGPEMAKQDFPGQTTTSHYTTLTDVVASYAVTDQWTIGLNGDVGTSSFPVMNAHDHYFDWYGVAVYNQYRLNDYATFHLRTEWFYDGNSQGMRLAQSSNGVGKDGNMNIYEVTAGVTITPFPKDAIFKTLQLRPEVRWDHAEDKVFNNFGGTFRDREQVTVAMDVIFAY